MSINANNAALNEILESINELPEAGSGKEEQEKSIDITENGETVVTPDDENTTLSKVTVNVEVPTKDEQSKTIDITENGTITVVPDEGVVWNEVTVNTAVESGGGGTEDFVGIKYSNFDSTRGIPKVADARTLPVNISTSRTSGYVYLFANSTNNKTTGGWHSMVEDFYLPDGIKHLFAWMFYNCGSIKNIHGDLTSLNTIYQGCFQNSGLEKFDYYCPALTQIQQKAFSDCSNLIILTLRANTLVSLANVSALNYTPIKDGTGYIYVPKALIEEYKVATNWATYANQFRALEDYTVDGTITGKLDENKI